MYSAFNKTLRILPNPGARYQGDGRKMLARTYESFGAFSPGCAASERGSYRGYSLEISKCLAGWTLRVHPMRPELPILARHTFTVASPRKDEAIAAAHKRIDLLLSH
jgi:hypothetical protein